MNYEQASFLDQSRIDLSNCVSEEMKWLGITDGAFGFPPQYIDHDYLLGYIDGVKQLPADNSGKIIYHQLEIEPIPNYDDKPF